MLQGAASGMIVSHIITLWITFGGLTVDKKPIELLPLSTAGCSNDSYSQFTVRDSFLYDTEYRFEWANHSNAEQPLYKYGVFENVTFASEEAVPIMSESE